MQPGEIIVFRHRGDVHVGIYKSNTSKKIKAATGQNRVFEVPVDRLLYTTGVRADDDVALSRFRQTFEEGADSLDLRDAWELLKEEEDGYSFQDIAELYWGDDITIEQYGSTLLYLAHGCPYFDEQDTKYLPLSDDQVEANLTRIAHQQVVRVEHEAFLRWITNEEKDLPAEFTNRQRHCLTRIQQYAILGDDYDQSTQAKDLLQEIRNQTGGDLQRYAFDLIVRKRIWDEDEHLDLIRYDISIDFDEDVQLEAHAISVDKHGREDLTALPVFSIDDAYTMDVDDALSLERIDDGYRVGVHITDVSAFISRGSLLDHAAQQRMTSLYFPDRHIPMLPPDLSQGQYSLLQGQQRCAVSFFYDIDHDFTLLRSRIVPSIIINQSKLSYDEVDQILVSTDHPLADTIRVLNDAVDVFYAQRIEHGAIELDRAELSIDVTPEKQITVRVRTGESRAEHIVSELMILTNVMTARYFMEHQVPTIYRTQSETEFKGIDETPHEVVRRFLIMRQLKPLALTIEPKPHATLGTDVYCQITSPLRRYSDLVLQRQLISYIRDGHPCYNRDDLTDEISRIERSRDLNRIWSRREWYWLLKYLAARPKSILKAVVLEVRERNLFVELLDYGSRLSMRQASKAEVGDEVYGLVTQADAWSGTLRLVQVAAPEEK